MKLDLQRDADTSQVDIDISHYEAQEPGEAKISHFTMEIKQFHELLRRLEMFAVPGPPYNSWAIRLDLDRRLVIFWHTIQHANFWQDPVEISIGEFLQMPPEVLKQIHTPGNVKNYITKVRSKALK